MIWFEDMQAGELSVLGTVTVDREEALDFARRYDMQPFHLDDAAAVAHRFFGRLAISGWQTCAYAMRLMVQDMQARGTQSLGSPLLPLAGRVFAVAEPGKQLAAPVDEIVAASAGRAEVGPDLAGALAGRRLALGRC